MPLPPTTRPAFLQALPLLSRSLAPPPRAARRPRALHTPVACSEAPAPSPKPARKSSANTAAQPAAPPEPRGDTLLIVGLGNPGARFERTRHNIGFELVDAYARRHGGSAFRAESRHRALTATVRVHGRTVHLAKPTTFMNASGDAVRSLLRYYRVPRAALLVVADDIALDVGRLRMRARGSAGGHNGLKSVQKAVGGPEYARLKVGVGVPDNAREWSDFVLAKFSRAEQKRFEEVEWDVSDILDYWVEEEDMNRVMNKLGMMQKKA